jgi:hypothetical protein
MLTISNVKVLKVTGEVIAIMNEKDGYTATLKADDKQTYKATISMVNLQISGGTFKRHRRGELITVEGPCWTDDKNITHITVEKLN